MTRPETSSGPLLLPLAQAGVRIRLWRQEDLAPYRFWLGPNQDWHRWDAPYLPDLEQHQIDAAVNRVARAVQDHDGWDWPLTGSGVRKDLPVTRAVIADSDSDQLIGTVSWYLESDFARWGRAGIQIFDPSLRGKGRGQTALRLWTDYLFGATTWPHVDYSTWSGNQAMLAVGRNLGFTEVARYANARVVGARFYDAVVMGVARSTWELH